MRAPAKKPGLIGEGDLFPEIPRMAKCIHPECPMKGEPQPWKKFYALAGTGGENQPPFFPRDWCIVCWNRDTKERREREEGLDEQGNRGNLQVCGGVGSSREDEEHYLV